MACSSITLPSSQAIAATRLDVFREHSGLHRSSSSKDLRNRAGMRRSYSDNHLCYSVNRIRAASTPPKLKSSRSVGVFPFRISGSMIPNSLRSFLFDPDTSKDMNIVEKNTNIGGGYVDGSGGDEEEEQEKRPNWVDRLCEIRIHWKNKKQEGIDGREDYDEDSNDGDEGGCLVDYDSDEEGIEEEIKYDAETFSRFLAPVAWSDTKLFSKLSFLSNIAYVIPEIKAADLRRYYGLRFVTSSLEKKAEAAAIKAKLDQDNIHTPLPSHMESSGKAKGPEQRRPVRSSVAYQIAASAASYVQSHTKGILSRGSDSPPKGECIGPRKIGDQRDGGEEGSHLGYKSEVAAYVAASTMTAVVAAGEKEKQEAAREFQSLHSAPCDWFVCDDPNTYTRCFVVQGSETLSSWQANLLFEPVKFEGTDVLVHRGIYEAAKGIYKQFMPEIIEHLNTHGERARLQFTGHSLGGSLSLLVNLMLLTRKVVKPSALWPVVTFGSPFVFCGGQKILNDLGLDDNHVHNVVMHRDIVPRAFSCNYPDHVALVLRRLSSFHSHPCLTKNKLLYSPLGKLFILQPEAKSSPPHPLLPPGSALYTFDTTQGGASASALRAFLNCPHPLETLSDPMAYGSDGTILRDHDSSNYLKAFNRLLRQNKMVVRKARRQRNTLWPLLASQSPHSWSHDNSLEADMIVANKVMTHV